MTIVTNEGKPKMDCGCFVGLWIDDVRPVPTNLVEAGWCSARSFHEAIIKLELIEFTSISVDHDLASFYGNKEMTGFDIIWWLVARKQDGLYVPKNIRVHSANPAAWPAMELVIERHL